MRRREFLAVGAAGLVGTRLFPRVTGWRFVLDADARWSLVGPAGRAAISGAEIAVELAGDAAVPLAGLTDRRRLRSTRRGVDVTVVIGQTGGVEVTAEFEDGPPPRISVHLRGLDQPRDLVGVRFGDVRAPWTAAWIDGYRGTDPCAVATAGIATTGHGRIALRGGGAPDLALAFDAEDAGDGTFTLGEGHLIISSRVRHRALSADEGPASVTLTLLPGEPPLAALGRYLGESAPPLPESAPELWRYAPAGAASEDDLLAGLAALRTRVDPADCRIVLVGDGYQQAVGAWDTGPSFPHGHRWLTERIREAGFQPGLWLAPFLAAEASGIGTAHPDWLLQSEDGRDLAVDAPGAGTGPVFALDASRRDVQDYLRAMTRFAVAEWGYDVLQLDALDAGARGTRADRGASPYEALRAGLRALREGAPRALLLARAAPLQHAEGLFNVMQVGAERSSGSWTDLGAAAGNVARHGFLARHAWMVDPGDLIAGNDFTLDEMRSWAVLVTLLGGAVTLPGRLADLDEARLALLRRCVPTSAVRPAASDAFRGGQGPPVVAIARTATDRWMVAAVNWGEEPQHVLVDLTAAGAAGPFAAYDVWDDARRANVSGRVSLDVPPHASVVLGLRRARAVPFVLGSTRHIVQGAVDIAEEHWDARRRVLSGRSVALDGRPYAVTIAVPPGMHPRRCSASEDCEVEHPHDHPGAVWLTFARTPREVEWEVDF
jgi:alpha galactosidase C-like protein